MRNTLKYHLYPIHGGWLNDPNGLCQYQGIYHIFYQYAKAVDGSSDKCWYHFTTKDFIHYKDQGIAIYPDQESDQSGAYSGCCYVEDGMHIFYTGNVKQEGNHDYIHSGRLSNTTYIYSKDGIQFDHKKVVLNNNDYPTDLTNHIRDPKVYKRNGIYEMYLGARTNDDIGCVLVYESNDLIHWKYTKRISSDQPFGYMWECPDCIQLNEEYFLITCPQGIQQQGIEYQNENQNGYFHLNDTKAYDYQTLDYGYDFYAPQTFQDENGRTILIGWMGLPDKTPIHPTVKDGWQMALTLPRELKNINHKIYQYPIDEILSLKKNERKVIIDSTKKEYEKECMIHYENHNQTIHIQCNQLSITYENHLFSLNFLNDQTERKQRSLEINEIHELDIFFDSSSIEIFINHGEKSLTSRYYDVQDQLTITSNQTIEITYAEMNAFEYID